MSVGPSAGVKVGGRVGKMMSVGPATGVEVGRLVGVWLGTTGTVGVSDGGTSVLVGLGVGQGVQITGAGGK
jgi:hypothetical protein